METVTNTNDAKVEARSSEEVLQDINASPEELTTTVMGNGNGGSYTTTTTETNSSLGGIVVSNPRAAEIGLIVAGAVSLVIALVVFFTITMKKRAPRGKFTKYLREFLNFRRVWVASILKFVYLFLAISLTISSIVMMFFGGEHAGQMIVLCLLTLVFGNIFLRVGFEMVMITIGLWENTNDMRAVLVKDEEAPEEKASKEREKTKEEELEEEVLEIEEDEEVEG